MSGICAVIFLGCLFGMCVLGLEGEDQSNTAVLLGASAMVSGVCLAVAVIA